MQINLTDEEAKAVERVAARIRGHRGGMAKSANKTRANRRKGKLFAERAKISRVAA